MNYKKRANVVGGHETAKPMEVAPRMKVLLSEYEAKTAAMMNDIIHFHYAFEHIHPFQDGHVFIIEDAKKCIITGDSLNGNGRKTI